MRGRAVDALLAPVGTHRPQHVDASLLRRVGDDETIAAAITGEMARKRAGHGIDDESFVQPDRPMSAIGG